MNLKFVLIITIIFSPSWLYASEWRTPHTSKEIKEARESGNNLKSHLVGVEGEIGKISEGYRGKPLFELFINDKYGKEKIIIGSLLKAELEAGDMVEILFDILLIPEKDTKAKKLTNEKFMGLGLCIVNISKKYAMGAQPTKDLCNKWYMESFPMNYKDRN